MLDIEFVNMKNDMEKRPEWFQMVVHNFLGNYKD